MPQPPALRDPAPPRGQLQPPSSTATAVTQRDLVLEGQWSLSEAFTGPMSTLIMTSEAEAAAAAAAASFTGSSRDRELQKRDAGRKETRARSANPAATLPGPSSAPWLKPAATSPHVAAFDRGLCAAAAAGRGASQTPSPGTRERRASRPSAPAADCAPKGNHKKKEGADFSASIMAWPCITRACCIARFWNQLDKADIAVPLVFTKYSEATEHPGAPPQPSQERWPVQAAAEAREQEAPPGGAGGLAAGKASGADERDTRRKAGPAWMVRRAEGLGHEQTSLPAAQTQVQATGPEVGRGRAAADALNRQIREEVASAVSSSYRNEFRAWTDIKPVKPIKAKPQYKPPDDKMVHETSYSAQFKGEASKPTAADNKVIDRRRIRSLYSEPFKEPPKVEKPSVQSSKPKKTSASHKPTRKAKDKQAVSGQAAKKKSAEGPSTTKPDDKEQSKEMNNKLAEAKESLAQPVSDSSKNQGPVATEPEKDQGSVVPGLLKGQGPMVQEPLKKQGSVAPGPPKDLGPMILLPVKDQDHVVPEPLKNESPVISAPVKDQGPSVPVPPKNESPMIPARAKDQGSVVPESPKDQGPRIPEPVKNQAPMVSAPVKDQGPMVPEHPKDESAMATAPIKNQGSMVSEPVKNHGLVISGPVSDSGPVKDQDVVVPEHPKVHDSAVVAPVKNQGPVAPESVKNQDPILPVLVKDQGPMVLQPPKNQGPVVPEPPKNKVPIIPVPLKDQDSLVPAPAKDQGPAVPEPLKTQGPRDPQ
ncbi:hypothetical protein H8958_020892, partial [Nasalis larvatus]